MPIIISSSNNKPSPNLRHKEFRGLLLWRQACFTFFGIPYLSKRQPVYIIGFFSFPFYLPSLSLSRLSPPVLLAGEIFPCKGTASVRSSSTAALTGPRIERQPSANQRFGYSVKFPACLLAFAVLFPLLDLHVKSIPKGSRKGFDKREK